MIFKTVGLRSALPAGLVAAVVIASSLSLPVTAAEPIEEGRDALKMGEYEEAVEIFQKLLLESGDQLVQARLGAASAFEATGEYEKGLKVLQDHPEFGETAELLSKAAAIHLRRGHLEDARRLLEKAEKLSPNAPEILYLLGDSYRQSGLLDKARTKFNRSIEAYENLSYEDAEALPAEAFVYWGLSCVALNRYKDANDVMFDQASDVDAKNPFLLLEWGRIFLDKYDFPESRKLYREALEQNPYFADALVSLAENYLTDFQEGTKRFELAEKFLERALKVNPHHSDAYRARGDIWFYDGNVDKAIEDLEKALEENPANLRASGLLAACHYIRGEDGAFKEVEKRALTLNPKGAQFFHTIALAIEKKFRYPDCVRFCDRALELDPGYWPAYVTLGINCLRTGEESRGREFLEKSWEKDHYNVWALNTRKFLRHLDSNHVSFKNDRFTYYLPKEDAPIMRPYLEPLLDEAYGKLSKRYKVKIETPIRIECFSKHKWFSARTVGLEGFAASGACFGKLVTLTTPKALPQNWAAVAWHEFAHVVTIQLTNYRIPRWLTEGISVYEEGYDYPNHARNFQREIADAWASGRVLPMAELDFGFSKPKFPMQILLSYYQGCLVVQYITQKWGFDAVLKILDGYRKFKNTEQIFSEVLDEDLGRFDHGFNEYVRAWVEGNGYVPKPAEDVIPRLELKRESDPENVRVLNELAWAYLVNGNSVDATITAGKALEFDSASGDAHAILGMVRFQEKKQELAKQELEEAEAKGTRFVYRTKALLGDIWARSGKEKKKAIEYYEAAKKESPIAGAGYPPGGGNIYYKLAHLYEEEGEPEKAIQQMQELARFATEDGECRLRLVKYALERGDSAMAARYLDQLVAINPFDMQVHHWRARAAEDLGDHDAVIREVTILLGDPSTNTLRAHLSLARAYLGKEEFAKARQEANRVLEIDPDLEEAKEILKKAQE